MKGVNTTELPVEARERVLRQIEGTHEIISCEQMDSDALVSHIVDRLSTSMATTLRELEPFICEVWRRLDAGEVLHAVDADGKSIDITTKKEFCSVILGRTYRAVRYMLTGGNPSNQQKRLPASPEPVSAAEPESPKTEPSESAAESVRANGAAFGRLRDEEPQEPPKQLSPTRANPPADEEPYGWVELENGKWIPAQSNGEICHWCAQATNYRCAKHAFGKLNPCPGEPADWKNTPPTPEGVKAKQSPEPLEPESSPEPTSNREQRRQAFKAEHPEFEGKSNREVDDEIRRVNFADSPYRENPFDLSYLFVGLGIRVRPVNPEATGDTGNFNIRINNRTAAEVRAIAALLQGHPEIGTGGEGVPLFTSTGDTDD